MKMTAEAENTEAEPGKKELHPALKFALELGPLGIFFFANQRFDIFTATAAFMVAVMIALTVNYALTRKVAIMPCVTAVVVLIFGGLTLYLQDELFIKLKPTIVNMLFAAVLFGGLFFGKSLLSYLFDSAFKLTDEGWRVLTWRWAAFFVFLAIVNEVVWRFFSTDFWVSFKVFGVMPITFVFALSQMPLIMKYAIKEDDETSGEKRS